MRRTRFFGTGKEVADRIAPFEGISRVSVNREKSRGVRSGIQG